MLIIKDTSLSGLISSSLETGSTSGPTSSVTLDVSLKEHQDTIIWNFSDQTISVPAQMGHTQTELAALSALYENEIISLSAFAAFDDLRFIGSAGNDYVVIDGLTSSFTVEQFDRARSGVSFGTDTYIGDSHYLTLQLDDYNSGFQLNANILNGSVDLTTFSGLISAENVDRLDGSEFANVLTGDTGNNVIYGQGGSDTIYGGDGNDTLDGGLGNDTLTGGIGSDSFQFFGIFGSDTITDFSISDDSLVFLDTSGAEILVSSLTESINEDGDLVLTLSNSSNVTLQDLSNLTASSSTLNGQVVSRKGNAIEGANVRSLSDAGRELTSITTDALGNFNLTVSSNVTIEIEKDFINNGAVTVWDALDTLRLSVGLPKSDGTIDPLDFFAADINLDGKVSVWDALNILKYSVGLPSNQAHWRFIHQDFDTSGFSRSAVSYDDTLEVSMNNVGLDHTFVGILVGDVNATL